MGTIPRRFNLLVACVCFAAILSLRCYATASSISCHDINGISDLSITRERAAEVPIELNAMVDSARVAAGVNGINAQQLLTRKDDASSMANDAAVVIADGKVAADTQAFCAKHKDATITDDYLTKYWSEWLSGYQAERTARLQAEAKIKAEEETRQAQAAAEAEKERKATIAADTAKAAAARATMPSYDIDLLPLYASDESLWDVPPNIVGVSAAECDPSQNRVMHIPQEGSSLSVSLAFSISRKQSDFDDNKQYAICSAKVSLTSGSNSVFEHEYRYGYDGETLEARATIARFANDWFLLSADTSGGSAISTALTVYRLTSQGGAPPALKLNGEIDYEIVKSGFLVSGGDSSIPFVCDMCQPIRRVFVAYDAVSRSFRARGTAVELHYYKSLLDRPVDRAGDAIQGFVGQRP